MAISLQGMIERAARCNQNGESLRYLDTSRSWLEVKNRIAKIASALKYLGANEGDRVGILSLNCANYYEAMFAVPWAGCCVVPLNTRWVLAENEYAVKDSCTGIIFFDDAFSEQVQSMLGSLDNITNAIYIGNNECPGWAIDVDKLIEKHEGIEASRRGGDEMAGIFYTGGTTGFPKGVMQSHRAIWASAMSALPAFNMKRESRYLHAAPMFHMADLAGSMSATLSCCTHVIAQGFDPVAVLKLLQEQKISHTLLVPAMIKMLLNHPDAPNTDVSSLEMILYGASPMPAATLEQCMKLWSHVGLTQAYGQTELAPIATIMPMEDHVKGGDLLRSAGRPSSISDIRCVRDDGSDCELGEAGEVIVRGPQTMIGYWNKPEQTAKALRDDWVYTGDAGFFSETGHLYIVDRVKDMVITGGENVFTTEVENAVMTHPAVQDVAVIGVPSEEWGEAVHAIVILKPDMKVNEDEIKEHCRDRIAGYKLPKSVSFREEPLPLSGAGKVLKTELRKPYWENQARQVN
ncbi:MAG: long-chain-fatty-acid--CoA ligase [Pseudomonadales bacterium]|nr:long-chain-fatty-acid--CoA ligase [Pseudomonadales bacterium]